MDYPFMDMETRDTADADYPGPKVHIFSNPNSHAPFNLPSNLPGAATPSDESL
jgi:hypothetical protein